MMLRLSLLCFALVSLVALSTPARARAGTYDLHVCRGSDGTVFGTGGWVALQPQSGVFFYDLGCDDGEFGVSAGPLAAPLPAGFKTGWQFTLPQPLTIASLDADYVGEVTEWKGWTSDVWARRHNEPQWLNITTCDGAHCVASFKDQPMYGMGAIAVGIGCQANQPCAAGSYGSMRVSYLKLRLDDPVVPHVISAAGSLTSGATIAGVASVSFSASDAESGVRAATLEIDGHAVAATSFDSDSHSCREPFTRVNPCSPQVQGSLSADTTTLSDGPHVARVLIYDATGTNAGVAGPWPFTTANRLLRNLCISAFGPSARVRLKPLRVSFGRGSLVSVRWPTVPWAPAEAALLSGRSVLSPSSKSVAFSASRRSLLDVPRGHNRTIRVGIRPSGSTGPYACSETLKVRVRARVSLVARPRRLENGRRVHLRGKLAGGAIARGRTVVVEARAKGGRREWTPVNVVHVNRRGRFSFSYRFARTFQRTRYLFRARAPRQHGFPYVAGHSRSGGVVVAP